MDEDAVFEAEDDDDGDEGVFVVPGLFGPGDDASHMVNNADDWHDGAYPFTFGDIAVTTLGLAANIARAVNIFFLDLRHDMCASRNHGTRRRAVADYDADVASLPTTAAADG